MSYEIMRTDVLNVARAMLATGLTVGDSGSVSARVGESAGRILLPLRRRAATLTNWLPTISSS